MLRAIIIDDEQKGINLLHMIIQEFISDVKVVADTTSAGNAIELIENYKPEIVFLDINMPEMNGFELLEKLKWKNFNLVFVTAHEEYALQALKNNAMDYLLKPLDHNELKATIERIKNKTDNGDMVSVAKYASLVNELNYSTNTNKIFLNLRSGIEAVTINNIICLESQSNYTVIHVADAEAIVVARNLKYLEEEINSKSSFFMRVHHSYVVNTHKVTQYLKSEECIVMANGQQIPLAKSKKKLFYTWMSV